VLACQQMCFRAAVPSTRKTSFDSVPSDRLASNASVHLAAGAGSLAPLRPITRFNCRCSRRSRSPAQWRLCGRSKVPRNRTGLCSRHHHPGGRAHASHQAAGRQRFQHGGVGPRLYQSFHPATGLTRGNNHQGRTGGDHRRAAGEGSSGQIGLTTMAIDARVQEFGSTRPPSNKPLEPVGVENGSVPSPRKLVTTFPSISAPTGRWVNFLQARTE